MEYVSTAPAFSKVTNRFYELCSVGTWEKMCLKRDGPVYRVGRCLRWKFSAWEFEMSKLGLDIGLGLKLGLKLDLGRRAELGCE